jgi:cation diffusion facilitator family transporter
MSEQHNLRAIGAALLANVGVAVSKFVAFAFTGSSALLAEGVHSVADSLNEILLVVGTRRAKQPKSVEHPFGYGRSRYIYAFLVAIIIFSAGGMFALYEGIHKLRFPEPTENPRWALGVLVAAFVMEAFSFRAARKAANRMRGDKSWLHYLRHAKTPEVLVVLLEDAGALLGLMFAFIGVSLTVITGNGRYDGAGTVAIGALLVGISFALMSKTRSLLLGEAATPLMLKKIEQALPDGKVLLRVIHLRTQHLSPEELLITAKLSVPPDSTGAQISEAIDRAEVRVREAAPYRCLIFIEPDLDREA